MEPETKTCQSCHSAFVIEPDDFGFYERIKVPPPTWCPDCRLQRRICFRNERSLYKGACALCGKSTITFCSPDKELVVYCNDCWWSDGWEAIEYGREYDFSKTFFEQFVELRRAVPHMALWQRHNSENVSYSNMTGESKNVYLGYSVVNCEDVYYSRAVDNSVHAYDCLNAESLNMCYGDAYSGRCNNCHFIFRATDCVDSWFLFDCVNCQDCVMSHNLRNKRYVIRNKQYTKEEYRKKVSEEFDFGSHSNLDKFKTEFRVMMENCLHRWADVIKCANSDGDAISNAKNCHNCFEGWELENVKNAMRVYYLKDSMDISGLIYSDLSYEYATGGRESTGIKFSTNSIGNLANVEFTDFCNASSNVFACVALRNKQYCILNKQYTKEEYEALVPQIIEHMNTMPYIDKLGRVYKYGEFFPPELSPFAYNETIAQEYFPLTKEQALVQGYKWRDPDTKQYTVTKQPQDLPDHIKDTPDSILEEVIGCGHGARCNHQCTSAFKLIPQELGFYKKIGLPIPRLCPNCRHYERLKLKNPYKLWHRKCMKPGCSNEFETSYAPDRPEMVYCEQCYNAEVA